MRRVLSPLWLLFVGVTLLAAGLYVLAALIFCR